MCEPLHTSLVVQKMHVVEKAGVHYPPIVTGDFVTTNPNLAPAAAGASFLLGRCYVRCAAHLGSLY
jgi:hypothetical protein